MNGNSLKKMKRVKEFVVSHPQYREMDYDEQEKAYQRELLRKKMLKYYGSNRDYQRLSSRIHWAKSHGNTELVEQLKTEREQFKKTCCA